MKMWILPLILILALSSPDLYSDEYNFKRIKLSNKLRNRIQLKNRSAYASESRSKSSLLLSSSSLRKNAASIKDTTEDRKISPKVNEDGTIFEKIIEYLGPRYQGIGNGQTASILHHNATYDFGSQNCSGFEWQKPMGRFYIGVDRQLAPDLFDDVRWIVTDKFVLYVNAYTYLHNMKDDGLVDMSETEIAAFAGIEFRRIYTYVHFADSFNEGLTSGFEKLFLSFMKFRGSNLTSLEPYEIVKKQDFLAAHIGAGAHIPPIYGVSASAGVMISHKRVSTVTIQAVGEEDQAEPGEALRVSFERNKITEIVAKASLEAEFYYLLKLTLLSYELGYEHSDSEKIYLSFYEDDLPNLTNNSALSKDLRKLLKLKRPPLDNLKPYIVSRERRTKENLNSHYRILLYGKMKKYHTEQIKIQKDGIIKTFFRNRSEEMKYIKGFFSTILNSVAMALAETKLFKRYKAFRSKKLLLEYEGLHKINKSKDTLLDSEEKLSLKFDHEYMTSKTTNKANKIFKKYAVKFVKRFTTLPKKIIEKIKENKLKGPINISVSARVNKTGLKNFNQLSRPKLSHQLADVCRMDIGKYNKYRYRSKHGKWYKRAKYKVKLSLFKQSKKYRCYKSLKKKYNSYIKAYVANQDISLWKLKNFLISLNKYSKNKNDLKKLFGDKNVFYNGKLQAKTHDGRPYTTYFHDGKFNGLGVVDEFKKSNNLRAPASIK